MLREFDGKFLREWRDERLKDIDLKNRVDSVMFQKSFIKNLEKKTEKENEFHGSW